MRRPVARPRGLKGAAAGAAALFAAVTASVLALAAPANASSGYGQLIVNPGTSSPGQTVSILGTCPNNGSTLTGVYSAAFAGGQASITKGSVNFTGTATIAYGVSAGQYEVSAMCGPGSPMVVITVSGSGGAPSQPATAPSTTSWTGSASSPSTWQQTSSAPASTGGMGTGAMGGGTAPTPSASAKPTGTSPAMGGAAMTSASASATNPPVTSTGIVRVGLAGSGHSTMISTPVAAAAAAAIVITGTVSFLMIRRRRNTPGTHS